VTLGKLFFLVLTSKIFLLSSYSNLNYMLKFDMVFELFAIFSRIISFNVFF